MAYSLNKDIIFLSKKLNLLNHLLDHFIRNKNLNDDLIKIDIL